jgi:hypothetical protein
MTRARPILMSTPMIHALLDGQKMQTRRIMKPQPTNEWAWNPHSKTNPLDYSREVWDRFCPYGKPGDLLWVREKHSYAMVEAGTSKRLHDSPPLYFADDPHWDGPKWKPSIHMPRWASRLTLELMKVQVQRLHDITAEDARAEGLACVTKDDGKTFKYGLPDLDGFPGCDNHGWAWKDWHIDPRQAYKKVWDDINGHGSWNQDPFVWVLSFKVKQANVDQVLTSLAA